MNQYISQLELAYNKDMLYRPPCDVYFQKSGSFRERQKVTI